MITHINLDEAQKKRASIVGWVAVATILLSLALRAAYWATKAPLAAPFLPTEKMGKPTGEWVDWKSGETLSVQDSLRGHTTVLVFSVFDESFVGHPVGGTHYMRDLQVLKEGLRDSLMSFISLTRETFSDDGVRLVLVRMDPAFTKHFPLHACDGPCAHSLFLAGQTKGGRYGNHYEITYKWYKDQFVNRTIAASIRNKTERYSVGEGMYMPAFAIIDKDGDIRYLRDGFDSYEAYASLMHVLGKDPNHRQATLADFKMPLGKKNWMARLWSETMSFVVSMLFFGILLYAIFSPIQVVLVERNKRK